jgi:SOS response regulatory protein OraA/RecX
MPEVTALRGESDGLVSVEVDGLAWRTIPAAVALRAGLEVGAALTRDRLAAVEEAVRRGRALDRAAALLERRDLSARQLDARLAADGIGERERSEALETLRRVGYVRDDSLARRRAETLAGRGAGDAAIRADLERLGIGRDDTEQALAELPHELERARAAVDSQGATPAVARRLARKGFSEETLDSLFGGRILHDG